MTRFQRQPSAPADLSTPETNRPNIPVVRMTPLLVNIEELATLLSRSAPSLHRDDAAGRLPAALRVGGSKRWRYADIVAWVEMGCPSRADFEALRCNRR